MPPWIAERSSTSRWPPRRARRRLATDVHPRVAARGAVPIRYRPVLHRASDGRGQVRTRPVTISMNEQTMVRRGLVPYGPSGAAVEALARVMAADLRDT